MINKFSAFQKLAELESMTKAAEAIGYSLSALSQMISSLENELGLKLVVRDRAGTKLTPEGAELMPYIEKTLNEYRLTLERAGELRGLETGTVRIGAFTSFAVHVLPELVSEFTELYPNVKFVIRTGNYMSIQSWLKQGSIDIGLVRPDYSEGLESEQLGVAELMAIVPEDSLLAAKDSVSLDEIAQYPFICLNDGYYYEPLAAMRAIGIKPDIRHIIQDDHVLLALVEQGLGVSILMGSVVEHTNYKVCAKHIEPPLYSSLCLGYIDRNRLPSAAKKFISLLKKRLCE